MKEKITVTMEPDIIDKIKKEFAGNVSNGVETVLLKYYEDDPEMRLQKALMQREELNQAIMNLQELLAMKKAKTLQSEASDKYERYMLDHPEERRAHECRMILNKKYLRAEDRTKKYQLWKARNFEGECP